MYTGPVEPGRDLLDILLGGEDSLAVQLLSVRKQLPMLSRLKTIVLKLKEGGITNWDPANMQGTWWYSL